MIPDSHKTIIKNQTCGKGMTMSLKIITDENGEHLRMHNSYFGGTIFQSYSKNIDTTTIKAQIYMMYSPKWLMNKLGSITTNNQAHLIIDDGEVRLEFTGYNGQLHSSIDKKGIAFQGNIQNISAIRQLKSKLTCARDIIKHNSFDELINCAISSKDIESPFGHSVSYEHKLDPHKFFALDGNKD